MLASEKIILNNFILNHWRFSLTDKAKRLNWLAKFQLLATNEPFDSRQVNCLLEPSDSEMHYFGWQFSAW